MINFDRINFQQEIKSPVKAIQPSTYILSKDLIGAVNMAIALDQPLLLTGEPGTGKTQLAYKIAYELNQQHNDFLPDPLIFQTKTTSASKELFYTYDAIRHFQEANIKKENHTSTNNTADYIELRALGQAIALTNPNEVKSAKFIQADRCRNAVVLIDEIDKAPRDFPNDILSEIERNKFVIMEANNHVIKKGQDHRIVVIMTSNSEKNLPEPFLRRCVFFHIEFPDQELLQKIVQAKLGVNSPYSDRLLIEHFEQIRATVKKKRPATAELVAWLKILELSDFINGKLDLNNLNQRQREILRLSYSVIAKNKEDLRMIKEKYGLV